MIPAASAGEAAGGTELRSSEVWLRWLPAVAWLIPLVVMGLLSVRRLGAESFAVAAQSHPWRMLGVAAIAIAMLSPFVWVAAALVVLAVLLLLHTVVMNRYAPEA